MKSSKYKCPKKNYDILFRLCAALTNARITLYPLRNSYFEARRRDGSRLYSIGEETASKRDRVQERYRERCRQRLDMTFRAHLDFHDSE